MDEFGYQQQTKLHDNNARGDFQFTETYSGLETFKSHNNKSHDNYTSVTNTTSTFSN